MAVTESHVGVAPDGTGKAIDATVETTSDGSVYRQRVAIGGAGNDNSLDIDAAGKIGVNNFPATQPVSGSVAVSNFPATQPVSGTVAVSNLPATQPVSGSVNVGNFPATQAVSSAAASQADGHSATIGTTTDASSANTLVGLLKAIKAFFGGGLPAALAASGGLKVDLAGTGTNATAVKVDGSAVTQPVSGTVTTTPPANASTNVAQLGGVTAPSPVARGTQGSTAIPTQDLKDSGRVEITLFLDAVAGITTEALATMQINKDGVAQTSATSYTVTAGKRFRITGLHTSVKNTSTAATDSRVRLRQAASGITVASPIILINEAGTPAAIANSVGTDDTIIPDGHEVAGGQQLAISHIESATTSTVSVVLTGFEY